MMQGGTFATINRLLAAAYRRHKTPIVELTKIRTANPFLILLTTILSSRTRDETTAQVSERLFTRVRSPQDLQALSVREIESLIYPIGFYHTKARHLKQLPGVLRTRFNGSIPDSVEALCELPGVGRKVANLVVAVAFNKPAICVDVHVHRICNRLGLLSTRSPFETEMTLRRILPKRYWINWNAYLVSHGQATCYPRNPWCDRCPVWRHCRRIGVNTRHLPNPEQNPKPAP